jgi:hypothetical protein
MQTIHYVWFMLTHHFWLSLAIWFVMGEVLGGA